MLESHSAERTGQSKTHEGLRTKTEISRWTKKSRIFILYLNVGRFWLLELEVPVLVSRNAVPQPTTQGQAGKKFYQNTNKEEDDLVSSSLMISMMSLHLLKVEASGGKEAPASLLLSLNGVGAGKGAAKLLNYFLVPLAVNIYICSIHKKCCWLDGNPNLMIRRAPLKIYVFHNLCFLYTFNSPP